MAYTTINKSSLHMNTKLYTGNGSTQSITGVGFQPDFTWIKPRSQAEKHSLTDAVRGAGKVIQSDTTVAEFTNTDYISSFISDGFSIGSNFRVNTNSTTYASWNWKANGTGSANTDGSISSTVSANTTSGFSIVSWNGNSGTIGHGLGVKPAMIIVKSRQTANNWVVMHKGLTGGMDTNVLVLNGTGAEGGGGAGMAEPTSSVFTITGGLAANDNNIGYVFADVPGYSKFGSYLGNSADDGTFVYTGFKPALIIVKRINSTGNWVMHDNRRSLSNGFNVNQYILYSNSSSDEITDESKVDLLSNGFKFRNALTDQNANGSTYIYMAFAEAPLVGTNGVTAKAR